MLTHARLILKVSDQLASLGWTPLNSVAVASKFYDTAVGPKEALVYLTRGDGINFTLHATYYSEGSNAVSNCFRLIPVTANWDNVEAIVKAFVSDVDAKVALTYAARLLKLAA